MNKFRVWGEDEQNFLDDVLLKSDGSMVDASGKRLSEHKYALEPALGIKCSRLYDVYVGDLFYIYARTYGGFSETPDWAIMEITSNKGKIGWKLKERITNNGGGYFCSINLFSLDREIDVIGNIHEYDRKGYSLLIYKNGTTVRKEIYDDFKIIELPRPYSITRYESSVIEKPLRFKKSRKLSVRGCNVFEEIS